MTGGHFVQGDGLITTIRDYRDTAFWPTNIRASLEMCGRRMTLLVHNKLKYITARAKIGSYRFEHQ